MFLLFAFQGAIAAFTARGDALGLAVESELT